MKTETSTEPEGPVTIDGEVDMVDLLQKLTAEHPETVATLESFGYKLPETETDASPDVAPVGDEVVVSPEGGPELPGAAGDELPLDDVRPAGMQAARKAAIERAFNKMSK